MLWNSDAASAFVLAELGHGHSTVQIPRYGFWTSLWWLLATRTLPGHVQLWEVTGYAFALATAVIVGWATWRVAGRWAGVAAGATAVVVGPAALRSLLTVNWHTSTPFTAAVLGAYLVVLGRRHSWMLAVAIGLIAGANGASDPLLSLAGIAPFAVAAGVLAVTTKRKDVAVRAGVVLSVAAVTAVATDLVMGAVGYHVIPVGVALAGVSDLVPNFIKLGKSLAQLFGANHFFPGIYPAAPVRYAVTFLAFAGLGALLLAAVRLTLRRSEPTIRAYASYWATAAVLLSLAFCVTNQGTGVGPGGGSNYLLSLAPGIGAGVALLAAGAATGRAAVSLAIAAVAVINIAGIGQGRAEPSGGAQLYGPQLIRLLERANLTRGYASYWDAQSLTWKSRLRLLVAPVQACDQGAALCRFKLFTIDSWYHEHPGRSFLIVNPADELAFEPPATYGRPIRSYRVGPQVIVYVYAYDLARHILLPS